jgi:hypothetical protein
MAIEKIVNIKVDTNSATKSVDNLAKATNNLDASFDEVYKDLKPLTARMGEAEDRLYELANAGQTATAEYQGLLQKVGEYRKVQIQTDLAVDAASTTLASKLGGALNTVAGGFSLAQGAAGLMGSESQNLEKAILKVQSAMAISQGIETINESRKSIVALGNSLKATALYQKALSAATAVQTFVTNGATLAAKLLRGALISTGIGALVVGVGLLIANFDKVKKVVMTLIPGLSAVGDVVMSIVNTVTDFIGVTSEAQRELDKMVSESQKTLRKNQDFLDTQGDKYDEYTKRKIQANIDYAAKVKEVAEDETRTEAEKIKYLKDLRDKADRDIFQADKDRQAEKDKKAKEAQDKINEANKKLREEAKEKAKKDAEDLANAKKQQLENTKALENEITQAIGDAQDKNAEMFMTAQEAEERAINDKYFRIKELAIQQGKDINDIEIQQMNEINDVRLNFQKEKDAKEKEILDKKKEEDIAREKAVSDAKIDLAKNTLNLVAEIAGEGSDIAKGVAVAQATISGIEGTQNAFTTASKSPITTLFPAYPFIQAGLAGAFSALQIRKIMSTPKSGGGGSAVGGGGSAPAPPQFNIVGQSGTNQLAQTIAGQQNKPIEAFVVSSAVTTSQALDRNRVKTATFGG